MSDATPTTTSDAEQASGADRPDADHRSDVGHLSYEQAREELVSVVNRLEAGGASLEESLALWERGEALANRCEEWLHGAQQRLEAARPREDDATTDRDRH
ncbi:exodeoxyribonuclease 7 small subunit [Tersicoccus solisilvae]|uniref:Exodeoxyribonuclease 7 small subunit n=1 Tax=Tersicoccus solisilvae TaxID=1882339 RepID=A0ABQ1P4R7_9MICC|nr:exodeoxyribonuclease VII small subunit [Tersicoccus solisilvae]GGC91139.1 exodeoxyribonuclease 7 small subunit [Tersicoccus solisilvae]